MVGGKGNDTYIGRQRRRQGHGEPLGEGTDTVLQQRRLHPRRQPREPDADAASTRASPSATSTAPATRLNNLIIGNNGANILSGGVTSGNDTTPNGNDTLIGNGGDDSL